jgi:hypothetical protein
VENEELIATLERLVTDKTATVQLYDQLPLGTFYALVADPSASIQNMSFLTYDSNEARELPLFTSESRQLLADLSDQAPVASIVRLNGLTLWRRLLEVTEKGVIEAAIDPGEPHGIRVPREMILGMVATANEK